MLAGEGTGWPNLIAPIAGQGVPVTILSSAIAVAHVRKKVSAGTKFTSPKEPLAGVMPTHSNSPRQGVGPAMARNACAGNAPPKPNMLSGNGREPKHTDPPEAETLARPNAPPASDKLDMKKAGLDATRAEAI